MLPLQCSNSYHGGLNLFFQSLQFVILDWLWIVTLFHMTCSQTCSHGLLHDDEEHKKLFRIYIQFQRFLVSSYKTLQHIYFYVILTYFIEVIFLDVKISFNLKSPKMSQYNNVYQDL